MDTHSPATSTALDAYRATMRTRDEVSARELERRREHAWQTARTAADFLRDEFGAQRIVIFGSLVHKRWFSAASDIDLAVWGLGPEGHLVAVARLQDIGDIRVDLIRAERCPEKLLAIVEEEGVPL